MLTPINTLNTLAAHPLLPVHLNTNGKMAAPMMEGMTITPEKKENKSSLPSTYLK